MSVINVGPMKKLLLALGLLLAVGAGCVSLGKVGGTKTVEGDWYLAFDLPSGWVMTVPYQTPNTEPVTPSQTVDRGDNEVYLQSTGKALLIGGVAPEASVPADSYVTLDNNMQIRVSRLDPHRAIPSEAEDLGHDFSRVKLCEEGEDCQIGGRSNYDYYFHTDSANYKFIVYGDDVNQAENVIMSAQEVTVTDDTTTTK